MERDTALDRARGYAMVLMVLGHCGLPYILRNPIYSFHMPLFFFITGYFFSVKPVRQVGKTLLKRVLIPYIVVCLLAAAIYTIRDLDVPQAYWSILLVKTSRPIMGMDWKPGIGPQWFLIAYLIAYIYLYGLFRKVQSEKKIAIILTVTFLICDIVARLYGLLPFGIMQGLSAALFIFVGYEMRNPQIRDFVLSKRNMKIGITVWIICAGIGFLSMASIYNKLSLLQVIGALYGTIAFIWLMRITPPQFVYRKYWT